MGTERHVCLLDDDPAKEQIKKTKFYRIGNNIAFHPPPPPLPVNQQGKG